MFLGCWWNTQCRRIHRRLSLSRRLFPRLRRQSHRASLNAACLRSYEDKTTDKVFDAAVVGRGGRAEGYKGKSDELLFAGARSAPRQHMQCREGPRRQSTGWLVPLASAEEARYEGR
jgi:hypothetical protein